jgi:DinB family
MIPRAARGLLPLDRADPEPHPRGRLVLLDALDNGGRRWRELYALRAVPCASFAELRREQGAADRRLIAFCDQLADDRLDDRAVLNRPNGRYSEYTRDVLAHLFQHDIHHRGQVHAMLAGTAVRPPQLDEFFLAQDAELRADDLRALGWATS